MDPGSLSALMITVFLLGAAPGRKAAENCQCSCSELPKVPRTKDPPEENCCTRGRFRYDCVDGYTRKSGTSSLTKCMENSDGPKWKHVEPEGRKFECILDPKRPSLPPPPPRSTAAPPNVPEVTTTAYPKSVINATRQQQKTANISRESLMTAVPTSQPTQSAATSASLSTPASVSTPAATPSHLTNQTHSESSAAPAVQSEAGRPAVVAPKNSTSESRHDPGPGTAVSGLCIVGVLLVCCAAAGIAVFLRKRRSRRPDRRIEELTEEQKIPMSPMENAPSEQAC